MMKYYDPVDDDALYYAWCDGPGRDYPRHMVMMRDTETSPIKPTMVINDGWEMAFYAWVKAMEKPKRSLWDRLVLAMRP